MTFKDVIYETDGGVATIVMNRPQYRNALSYRLLDEIDAALDEENVGRLTNLLKEFSQNSQFIVITHNKRTVAGADVLYGVTMEESGVSKLVAIRLENKERGETVSSAAQG